MTRPESQPRHPLALLRELVGDWDRERGRHYFAPGCRPLSDYKGHYTYKVLGRCIEQVLAVMTQMESQESALRAQAEAEAGLREAVAQLMSDPWSYHEKGARCIDCGRLDVDGHSDDCAVVKIRVFIAQDELRAALAQAGGDGQ